MAHYNPWSWLKSKRDAAFAPEQRPSPRRVSSHIKVARDLKTFPFLSAGVVVILPDALSRSVVTNPSLEGTLHSTMQRLPGGLFLINTSRLRFESGGCE